MERKKYFKSLNSAKKYQKEHKRKYGYRPALFTRYNGRKMSRFIIIPKGLKRRR